MISFSATWIKRSFPWHGSRATFIYICKSLFSAFVDKFYEMTQMLDPKSFKIGQFGMSLSLVP